MRGKKEKNISAVAIDSLDSLSGLSELLSLLKNERLRPAACSILLAIDSSCHALNEVRF